MSWLSIQVSGLGSGTSRIRKRQTSGPVSCAQCLARAGTWLCDTLSMAGLSSAGDVRISLKRIQLGLQRSSEVSGLGVISVNGFHWWAELPAHFTPYDWQ
jgi:hypothetical protein